MNMATETTSESKTAANGNDRPRTQGGQNEPFRLDDFLDSNTFNLGGLLPKAQNRDQFLSLVLGGIGMILLLRRFFVYFALALTSSYLLYRGLGCQMGQEEQDEGAGGSARGMGHSMHSSERETRSKSQPETAGDGVDEALRETFPASDPPATY